MQTVCVQSTAAVTFHKISENIFSYIFQVLKPCGGSDLTAPNIPNLGSKSGQLYHWGKSMVPIRYGAGWGVTEEMHLLSLPRIELRCLSLQPVT
jgi:hypothetical protein